jgi:cystathionine beta-lyase family protein involved in aluminum resistance
VPARIAGVCGLLAFATFNVARIAGGLAQPSAYIVANDDILDPGAMTAASPWIYNRVGANLTGILVLLLGFGLYSMHVGTRTQRTHAYSRCIGRAVS